MYKNYTIKIFIPRLNGLPQQRTWWVESIIKYEKAEKWGKSEPAKCDGNLNYNDSINFKDDEINFKEDYISLALFKRNKLFIKRKCARVKIPLKCLESGLQQRQTVNFDYRGKKIECDIIMSSKVEIEYLEFNTIVVTQFPEKKFTTDHTFLNNIIYASENEMNS